jgi:hypothetical protein
LPVFHTLEAVVVVVQLKRGPQEPLALVQVVVEMVEQVLPEATQRLTDQAAVAAVEQPLDRVNPVAMERTALSL